MFEQKSLMVPTIQQKKACDQLFLTYKEENKRLGVNVLIQYPGPMGTKLRKKMIPGEKNFDPDDANKEARRIISKILTLTKSERIIT